MWHPHRQSARLSAVALGVLLISLLLLFAGTARGAGFAAGPMALDPGQSLWAVTCPSASQCTAVTATQELTFDPLAFKRPPARAPFRGRNGPIASVWCPTTSLCATVRVQAAVSFVPRRFRYRPSKVIDTVTDEGINAVRCPTRVECVAVDSNGDVVTYNPQTNKLITKLFSLDGSDSLTGLACPSAIQCTAVNDAGDEITFQPRTGHRLGGLHIDPAVGLDAPSGDSIYELDAVSCPSTGMCAAVDELGNLITFDPLPSAAAAPSTSTTFAVDPGNSLASISCKPSGICVAVDRSGNAVSGSTATQSWQLQTIAGAKTLNAVACPTSSECVAVDSAGNAFRLYPTP